MPAAHFSLVVLINLVWGANLVFTKMALADIPPVLFAALRFAIVLLALLPFLRIVPGRMTQIAGIGVTMGLLHFTLIYVGLDLADDVATVAIATQLIVPFSTLLSIVFLRERIGWRRTLGIALAFGGMLFIGFDPVVFDYALSLWLVAAGAMAGAVAMVLMKQVPDVPVFTMQAWIALIACPGLFGVSAVIETGQVAALAAADGDVWLVLVFSGLGAGLLGHSSMNWLLKRHDVSVISPLTLLSTVFGVVLGVVLLDDHVSVRIVTGGLLSLAGVLIIARRQPRRGPAPALVAPAIGGDPKA